MGGRAVGRRRHGSLSLFPSISLHVPLSLVLSFRTFPSFSLSPPFTHHFSISLSLSLLCHFTSIDKNRARWRWRVSVLDVTRKRSAPCRRNGHGHACPTHVRRTPSARGKAPRPRPCPWIVYPTTAGFGVGNRRAVPLAVFSPRFGVRGWGARLETGRHRSGRRSVLPAGRSSSYIVMVLVPSHRADTVENRRAEMNTRASLSPPPKRRLKVRD